MEKYKACGTHGVYEIFGGLAILPEGVKNDISLAIENDRIVDIGKTSEMRRKHKFSESVGSKDAIICPAFVDSHMHSFQIATRGLTSDKSLLNWLKKYIWKWEGTMTREQAKACAELAYLELIRSGVTTFADYTSVRHTEQAFLAAKKMGLRGNIGKTLMDRASPPELQEPCDKALRESESLIRKWHGTENGRLRYNVTPRFGISCSDELLKGCGELAEKYGTILTTHANESRFEINADRRNYKKSSIEHLYDMDLLGPHTLLVHCVWLSNREMKLLAKTNTKVAHCPGSNMMLASGSAPTDKMLDAGIRVGLGSDMGAYYSLSAFDQMRLAVLLRKTVTFNPTALTHQQVFKMATVGGANALGIEAGALKKGKKADVILLSNLPPPNNNLVSQLVYSGHQGMVMGVVCDGKILMRDGKVLVADERQIIEQANEILGA